MSKKKSSKKHKDKKPQETEAVAETPLEQEPAAVEEPVVAEEEVAVEEAPDQNAPTPEEPVAGEVPSEETVAEEVAEVQPKSSKKKKRKGGKTADGESEEPVSEEPPAEEAIPADGVETAPEEGADEPVSEEAPVEAVADTDTQASDETEDIAEEIPALTGDAGLSLKMVVEAILFASQKPVSSKEIISVLKGAAEANKENPSSPALAFGKIKEPAIQEVIEQLENDCAHPSRVYEVRETAAGWQLVTKPGFSPWLRQIYPENRPARLSAPALETLAIIAYRQPITRADIEAVRGVAVDGVMQTLLDRGLVKIAGRADIPGRPLLYDTTQHFMEHFGLKDLDDLPNAAELRKIALPKAEIPEETPAAKPADTAAPAADATAPAAESAEPVAEQSAVPAETTESGVPTESPQEQAEPAAEDGASEPADVEETQEDAPETDPLPVEPEEEVEQPDSAIESESQPTAAPDDVVEFSDVPESAEPAEEAEATETVEAVETIESPESAETYEAAEISDTPETGDPSRSENQ